MECEKKGRQKKKKKKRLRPACLPARWLCFIQSLGGVVCAKREGGRRVGQSLCGALWASAFFLKKQVAAVAPPPPPVAVPHTAFKKCVN